MESPVELEGIPAAGDGLDRLRQRIQSIPMLWKIVQEQERALREGQVEVQRALSEQHMAMTTEIRGLANGNMGYHRNLLSQLGSLGDVVRKGQSEVGQKLADRFLPLTEELRQGQEAIFRLLSEQRRDSDVLARLEQAETLLHRLEQAIENYESVKNFEDI